MEFVANHKLNTKHLLKSLRIINKTEFQHACEVYGRFARDYNLQAIHLSVFMLKVLPLKPHEDEYWNTLAVTVTGGIWDITFKHNTVKILKGTWNKHKKEVLQNLYRCKQLVNDNALHLSINNLLQIFSKHWLDLDHVGNLKILPPLETAEGPDEIQTGILIPHLNDAKQNEHYPATSRVKSTLTIEHLVMAMKKVHPFSPNKLGYWIALVSTANNKDSISIAKVHAKDLQEFWQDNKELLSLLTGEPLQCDAPSPGEYLDSLNLMNVSDDSDIDEGESLMEEDDDNNVSIKNASKTSWPKPADSTKAVSAVTNGKFQYSGNCKLYPDVQLCVADVLHAIGTTIPFTPSDHGFWLKVVKKIIQNPRQNINLSHAATKLKCMWLLSMQGVSTIQSNNAQMTYKSLVIEASDCELQFTDKRFLKSCAENTVKSPDIFSGIALKIWKPHYGKFGGRKSVGKCEEIHFGNDRKQFKFHFDAMFMNNLKDSMTRSNRFASNTWKRYILRKIKQHNQYCMFVFKSHWVSNRIYSKHAFYCHGFCKRSDCKLQFKVYVQNDVTFSTVVTFYNVSQTSCKFALLNEQ